MALVDGLTVMFLVAFGGLQVALLGILVVSMRRDRTRQRTASSVMATGDLLIPH